MTIEIGTRFIGPEQQDPQNFSFPFVKTLEQRIPVYAKSVKSSRKMGLLGRSKRYCVIPQTGCFKSEEKMKTEVARGFLTLLLDKKQRDWMHKTENSLPLNRYLTPSEVYSQFPTLMKKTVSDAQVASMEHCWGQFWKTKQIETNDMNHEPKQKQLQEWEKWVLKQFVEPLPDLVAAKSTWGEWSWLISWFQSSHLSDFCVSWGFWR